MLSALEQASFHSSSDEEIVHKILEGETLLFEIIMRRHSQRLYRVARGILRDRWEAEDVMQTAFVRAYQHLAQFAGRARFSTWLTRIAVHQALNRLEERTRLSYIEEMTRLRYTEEKRGPGLGAMDLVRPQEPNPEQYVSAHEEEKIVERATLALPPKYRVVIIMRELEDMSVAETAQCLDITEENVKIRLHRAHAMLRQAIYARVRGNRFHKQPPAACQVPK